MAIRKRGSVYHLRIRPFGEEIGVTTPASTKQEARRIEMAIMTACRSSDYRALDPASRAACVQMFRNKGWSLPSELAPQEPITEELTVWKAAEFFLKYPEIRDSKEKERYQQCILHLVKHFGKEKPMKSIWVPEIKAYVAQRLSEGAAPSTANREKGTLSKMFQVLVELRLIETNPCRLVKNLSQKAEERQVYLSNSDFRQIVDLAPAWVQPILTTAYYSGMRRGEILGLTRGQINLSRRMMLLGPKDTKEGHWKRVPIHTDLLPVLERVLKVQSLGTDQVFLVKDQPPNKHSLKNPWLKAVRFMELDPRPRFHDLRHTWKTNARRSGMDPEIREAIMGHWSRGRNVNERYGRISEEELIRAIDSLTVDHGETEIVVARR
jgi:integrase